MSIFHVGLKLFLGYIFLYATTKLLGREQLSQVSLFDFISAIILGEIIGNALYDRNVSFWFVIANLVLWTIMKVITEIVELKTSVKIRAILDGKPSVLIRQGQIDMGQLRKNRLHIQQLMLMIREWGVFSLSQVEYAIMETDGRLTVIKKPEYQNPTYKDLNLPTPPTGLPFAVIIDGQILKHNLQLVNENELWLREELRKQGYPDISKIVYTEITEDHQVKVIPAKGGI